MTKDVSRETVGDALQGRLSRWLDFWGVTADDEHVQPLVEFAFMLSDYKDANIIGTRDVGKVLDLHIADSLSCLLHDPLHDAGKLVDVGSGGGLPGLPLQLCLPDARVHLVEATGKKAAFLEKAVARFSLANTCVINGRAEDFGQDTRYRATYDVATVRAVASLPVLVEYCLPLVKIGGRVMAMKGRPSPGELDQGGKAARILGGALETVIPVPTLPEAEPRNRCLVVFKKERRTPSIYPRRVGAPRKDPLGEDDGGK
ncbi:MAG: 16S rRNA (guanine(527)-N(7))-methyltransferase RsmG [Rubrobacteraceae bacterium]